MVLIEVVLIEME